MAYIFINIAIIVPEEAFIAINSKNYVYLCTLYIYILISFIQYRYYLTHANTRTVITVEALVSASCQVQVNTCQLGILNISKCQVQVNTCQLGILNI